MHAATTAALGQDNWKENLRRALRSESILISPPVAATIQKYGPVALAMVEFSQQLMNEDIRTPPSVLKNARISTYAGAESVTLQSGARKTDIADHSKSLPVALC
jgi:hypothetical protein